MIRFNSIVKLVNPLEEEKELIYIVKEINDNRVLITCLNTNMSIQPTELVSINDIECLDF